MAAEELRLKGNTEFASRRFEEAIKFYDEAIAIDPKNIDLHNNRSAANFELKRFQEAIDDANRSLKVSSNSKALMRKGAACWAMGKLEDARLAYELALSAAPGNQTIRDNLNRLRQLLAADSGTANGTGAFQPSTNDLLPIYADVAVLALAVMHVLGMFLSGMLAMVGWRFALGAFAVRQFLILRQAGLVQPNMETLKKWPTHFSAQYFVISVLGFALSVPPLHLLLAAMVMYCIVDLAGSIQRLQAFIPPSMMDKVAPQLQKAQQSRDILLGNAATCEAMLTFMLLFSGASVIFNVVYVQFIKYRYRNDPFSRLAFSALRQTIEKVTRHPKCPQAVDGVFSKFCDLIGRVGGA